MDNNSPTLVLRIFISSTDKFKNELLYESLVFKAKEMGLAGATVLKGVLGYGGSSIIHSYKFWEISDKLPTVIEIIDEESKILLFSNIILPILKTIRYGCLVTTEKINVLLYKSGNTKF
jgi:PII-like signaling protein